jgi:quinol monooxygenase YgiN
MAMKSNLCAALVVAFAISVPAAAQNNAVPVIDGPTYLFNYVEVAPSASAQALNALKQYRDAARKEPGAIQIDLYREKGQTQRFVLEEIWQNREIAKAHGTGAASTALVQTLKPIELGPPDIRVHQVHMATPPKAPNPNDIVLISHADVAGGNTNNLIRELNALWAATRNENGMVRYEILDEVPLHSNHFRIVEEWTNLAALEAHDRAPAWQAYRDAILPWLGTPYDQRFYTVVN